jgi:uncharacterized protein
MFFSVKELELRRVRFDEVFPPGEIEFFDKQLRQATLLHALGTAELLANTQGEIRVRGSLSVVMESECDRCLEKALFPIESAFDLFYRPMSDIAVDEEVAIDEGETDIGFYENGGVELGDVLREHVLLSLPMQRICREDCKGICPVCGRNRNLVSCGCEPPAADDRWSALKNIYQLKKEF